MKVECIHPYLLGRDQFEAGDRKTVTDDLGRSLCETGHFVDLDGNVETPPLDSTRRVVLQMHRAAHGNDTSEAG